MKLATPLDPKPLGSNEIGSDRGTMDLKWKSAMLGVYFCYVTFLIRFSLPPVMRRGIFPWLVFLVAPLPALLTSWLPRRSPKR